MDGCLQHRFGEGGGGGGSGGPVSCRFRMKEREDIDFLSRI